MHSLAILLIGFSVFSAVVMGLTHFHSANYSGQKSAQKLGILLLIVLSCLQLAHFAYLQYDTQFIHGSVYSALLFTVAPTFYLFSKPLLQARTEYAPYQLLHAAPIISASFLPYQTSLPLAFAIGAGYLLWLARNVYALRAQRSRFRAELTMLGLVFLIAAAVLILGLMLPLVGEPLFFALYATAIGCAFLLVNMTLNSTPRLSTEVAEAAREAYAVSTLGNIDCEDALQKLSLLMEQDRIFQQTNLDLPMLAFKIGVSSHQLSELINGRLGKGFSRYIREYRIDAAKKMLLAEPSASVLSIGMSVGFTTQSNFYDAFREITGMTPGKFRKISPRIPSE